MNTPIVVVVSILALVGCGEEDHEAISCTTPASGPKVQCLEIIDPTSDRGADLIRQSCEGNQGTFARAPCDRSGALGGCRANIEGASFSSVTWYYPAGSRQTQADVMAECARRRETFLAP